MSQKTDLQATNTDLQAILDLVNSLPDKEEGPSYETCTLTCNRTMQSVKCLRYSADSGVYVFSGTVGSTSLDGIVCGSLVYINYSIFSSPSTITNGTVLYPGTSMYGYYHCILASASNGGTVTYKTAF